MKYCQIGAMTLSKMTFNITKLSETTLSMTVKIQHSV
jgi:hypothetical protein